MAILRSIWAWLSISFLVIVWVPIMAVVHWTDRDPGRYRTGRWFRRLGSAMAAANPAWTIQVSGNFPEDPRAPFVVVCNHQSLTDIPVVSRLPWDMKWVGKESLFHLPVLGWMMRISRDIPVLRGDRRSRAQVFIEVRNRLRQKVSVLIMPEGTRSPDGSIRAFSDGPFKMALKEGVPILPLALDGTFGTLPKKSWIFGEKSLIRVHVFDPIQIDEWQGRGSDLCDHVRDMIVRKVAEWRGVAPEKIDGTVGEEAVPPIGPAQNESENL